jgi:hypothetical protein
MIITRNVTKVPKTPEEVLNRNHQEADKGYF